MACRASNTLGLCLQFEMCNSDPEADILVDRHRH